MIAFRNLGKNNSYSPFDQPRSFSFVFSFQILFEVGEERNVEEMSNKEAQKKDSPWECG